MSYENLKKFLNLPKAQYGAQINYQDPRETYRYQSPFQFNNQPNPNQGMPVYSGYNPDFQVPTQANPYTGTLVYSGYNPQTPDTSWFNGLNTNISNMMQAPVQDITTTQNVSQSVPMVQSQNIQPQVSSEGISISEADLNNPIVANQAMPSLEMRQRMLRNQYANTLTNNYDENGNAINVQQGNNQIANNKFNLFNPYGSGIDNQTALSYGFYNLGQGNTGQGILGLGKGLFGTARQGFNAFGAGRNQRELLEAQNNEPVYSTTYLQDGGYVFPQFQDGGEISVAKFLSGKFITDSSDSTIEIEDGEFTLNSQNGQVQKAVGETHENGGIKTNLPDKSQVLSDHTKIGAKNAKDLSKELDVKVKAKNTFADVMDKYSKKIGVEKNIEESEKLTKNTEDTLRMDENDTKQINMNFIQEETARIEEEKQELNTQQQEAFQKIFDKQEADKGNMPQERPQFQEGGEIAPATQQEEMNPNDVVAQVQQMMAQGAPIEEIVNGLLSMGYSEDQASQIIQASQSQQQPQMQDGGTAGQPGARIGDFLKSVQAIAQTKGVEAPEIDLSKGNTTSNWTALQNWMVKNAPEEVVSYFDNQPLTNKGMDLLLKNRKTDLKKIGVDVTRKPESFSLQEKRAIQEAIPLDSKFILDQFADGKADWRFPVATASALPTVATNTQGIMTTNASPSATGIVYDNQASIEPTQTVAQATGNQQQNLTNTRIPLFPSVNGMAPSAALIPRNDQVRFNRIDPTLRTPEASVASINNQTNFVNQEAFLSNPNLAPFLTATNLGTTQQSVNKAIAETDAYNAEAVNRANTYNAQVGDKEQLMNINLAGNYEQRLFKTIGNQEEDWRRYLLNKEMQNKQNWMDVNNLNLQNAMFPNYQTDGSNVYFSSPKSYAPNPEQIAFNEWYRTASQEEKNNYQTNYKQDGGYIFEDGATPITAEDEAELVNKLGFTPEFAREYFRRPASNQQTVMNVPMRRNISNPQVDTIADITAGTNRYTPDGGVIVGDYRKVWTNNRPEYFTGKAQPQEGVDFTYFSPQDFAKFQQTSNYQNYKAGYKKPDVAVR